MFTAQPTTTVVVVDDDDFMRELIQESLRALGVLTVHGIASGREALQWLERTSEPPSLLVSDIYMPGMDGFEFIQALADMGYAGKVLLCSGVSLESLSLARDVADGMGLRVAGALPKPLSADALSAVLQENGL